MTCLGSPRELVASEDWSPGLSDFIPFPESQYLTAPLIKQRICLGLDLETAASGLCPFASHGPEFPNFSARLQDPQPGPGAGGHVRPKPALGLRQSLGGGACTGATAQA